MRHGNREHRPRSWWNLQAKLPAALSAPLLVLWVGCSGELLEPSTSDPAPGPSFANEDLASVTAVRRLSQRELDNTVDALLHDETRPATRLLTEDEFSPFDNDYTRQEASAALVTNLEVLAEEVSQRALETPEQRAALVGCTPTGPGDALCFRAFLEGFLPRAFRRPVRDEEVEVYLPLLEFATEENEHVDNDFYSAVNLVIRAVLMDPEFLYRIERGAPTDTPGVVELNGHEIATRMSFLLWAAPPDDALYEDASSGRLVTADGRRDAALRMLEDPRAQVQIRRFHAMWLGYRTVPHSAELAAAFQTETGAAIDRVVFEERGDFRDLFRLDETYLTGALAEHYGLPAPEGGEGWVPYGDDIGRGGILSHGSVLSAFSKFSDTSPTQRGILIRTRLMCLTVPAPPPDVDVDQPPGEGDDVCKSDRYAAHTEIASCAGCHNLIDPIGFGLENYDMAGRFREHDDGLPECTIDGVGQVPGGESFSGPRDLAEQLLADGTLDACAIEYLYQFILGRPVDSEESATLAGLVSSFRESGYDLLGFLAEYIASERFARRVSEVSS